MSGVSTGTRRKIFASTTLLLAAGFIFNAKAQTAPQPAPPAQASAGSPAARAAIDVRKAVFTLIGSNFRPIGNVLKGNSYDAAEVQKSLARIAILAEEAGEAFPTVSNIGEPDTKAKADIWTTRADFDKKLKDFQAHAVQLAQINETEKGATEPFKTAAGALPQDCKGCHDSYKAK
jgi:cytochrome c556